MERKTENISIPDLRAEGELLLYCARPGKDAEATASMRRLVRRVDWTLLLRQAQHHGLLPLLAYRLAQTCPDAVPATWNACLSDYGRRTEAGGRRAAAELVRILRLFEANGIPAFTFRGPAMAAFVYGQTALREFNALNIVVQSESLLNAKALLMADGYRPARTLAAGQELAQVRFQCLYRLERSDDRMHAWLHTEIDPGGFSERLDLKRLNDRLEMISIDGEQVRTLSPEDLLITLCAYFVQPEPPRLCALADIATLVDVHRAMDWEAVSHRARTLGARRRLFAGLLLAGDLLGVRFPEPLAAQVRADLAARHVARELAERLSPQRPGAPGLRERIHFHLKARERTRDRIRLCARTAFTPSEGEWLAVALPAPCCSLYRLIRPLRLVGTLTGLVKLADLAPFMPAPMEAVERMLAVAEVGSSDVVYDIGSGDGRIVIIAAKRYGARGIGIDIDAGRIAEAEANAHREGVQHLVQFIQRNVVDVDLSAATVVTMYLGAANNLLLRPILQNNLRRGTRLVSLAYDMGDWAPLRAELVPHDSGVSQIFMWRIGENGARPLETASATEIQASVHRSANRA